jgi:hypothetical protein
MPVREALCVSWLLVAFVLFMQLAVATPEPPPVARVPAVPAVKVGDIMSWFKTAIFFA